MYTPANLKAARLATGALQPHAAIQAAEWERLGFQRRRNEGCSVWCGLKFKPARPVFGDPEEPAPVEDASALLASTKK